MNLDTTGHGATILPAPLAMRTPAPRLVAPGRFKQAAIIGGDVLALAGIALCIPFVIIGIGAPLALGIRFLLWMVGAL